MFSLNCLYKSTNESGSLNQGACYCIFTKKRYEYLWVVLNNLMKDEEIVTIIGKIIFSIFLNLNYEFSIVKMSRSKITTTALNVLKIENLSKDNYNTYMKILYYLSIYHGSHKFMLEEGILDFILNNLKNLDPKNIDKYQISEFAQLLKMSWNLFSNSSILEEMNKKGLINLIIEIYKKYFDINFIRDESVNCFYDISKNEIGKKILYENLNFFDFLKNIFESKSLSLIQIAQDIVINVIQDKNKITEFINNINFDNKDNIIFLSYISKCEIFFELLENSNLVEKIINRLKDSNDPIEESALLKSLGNILKISDSKLSYFIENNGIQIIKQKLSTKNYFVYIWILFLVENILNNFNMDYFKKIKDILWKDLYGVYVDLNKELDFFISINLNMVKSYESIEYNNSEMNRIIMDNLNYDFIDKKHSIKSEDAFNYIYIEIIICKMNNLFFVLEKKLKEIDNNYKCIVNDEVLNIGIKSLNAYKIKEVYESIFIGMKTFDLNEKQSLRFKEETLTKLFLESIWKNPGWKHFSYHLIETYNKILENKNLLPKFREINCLSIIASILLYVDEEDLSCFEEKEAIGNNKAEFETLTKQENDHILKIGLAVMNNLLEQDTLNVVLKNLKKKMDNLSGTVPKDVVPQLRSEFAILTVANLLILYGCEFCDLNGNVLVKEYHDKLFKMREFVNKNQLISESIRTITSLISITKNTKGREIYEEKEISKLSIIMTENILVTSKNPLLVYLSMRPLKSKLKLRIKIIEEAEGYMRKKIYNDNSLLLLKLDEQLKTIKNLISILLDTFRKFREYKKIKVITITIIILLLYMFKQYKNEFVNLGLISLGLELMDELDEDDKLNIKSLEMIDELFNDNEEGKNIFLKEDGINKLITANSKNDNPKFDKLSKQILEKLKGHDIDGLVKDKVLDYLKKLKEYSEGKEYPLDEIAESSKIISAYMIIPEMKNILNENGHPKIIENLLKIENNKNLKDIEEKGKFNELKEIISNNLKALNEHFDNNDTLNSVDSNNLIPNLLDMIEKYKDCNEKDPLIDAMHTLNNLFNLNKGNRIYSEVENREYFPKIKELYENYKNSNDRNLKNEVTNLFNNLNKESDSSIKSKLILATKNIINAQNNSDIDQILNSFEDLKNHFNNKEFNQKINKDELLKIYDNNMKLLNIEEDLFDIILKTFNGENLNSRINKDQWINLAEQNYILLNKILEVDGDLINNEIISKDFNNLCILANLNKNNFDTYTNIMNKLKNDNIKIDSIEKNELEEIKSLEMISEINHKDNHKFENKDLWLKNYDENKLIDYLKKYIESVNNLDVLDPNTCRTLLKYSRLLKFYLNNKEINLEDIDKELKIEFINSFETLLRKTKLRPFENEIFLNLVDFILWISKQKELLKNLKSIKLFKEMLLRYFGTSFELIHQKSGNTNYKESEILNSIKFTLKRNKIICNDLINLKNAKLEVKNEIDIDNNFSDLFEKNCYDNFWEYLLKKDDIETELIFKRKFEILRELCFNKNLALIFKKKFDVILDDLIIFENSNEESNRNYVNFIIMETISMLLILNEEEILLKEADFNKIMKNIINPIMQDRWNYYPLLTYKSLEIFKNIYYFSRIKSQFFQNDFDEHLINFYELENKDSVREIIEQEKNLFLDKIYGNDIFEYIENILMNSSTLNMSINTIQKQLNTVLFNNYLLLSIGHFCGEPKFNKKFFNKFNYEIVEYCYELIKENPDIKKNLESEEGQKFEGYLLFSSHNTTKFIQLIFFLYSEFSKNHNNIIDVNNSDYNFKYLENNLEQTDFDDLITIKNVENICNLIEHIDLDKFKSDKEYFDNLKEKINNKYLPFYENRPKIINEFWNKILKKIDNCNKELEILYVPTLAEKIDKILDNIKNENSKEEDLKNEIDLLSDYVVNFCEILKLNNLTQEEEESFNKIIENLKDLNDIKIDSLNNSNMLNNLRLIANSPYINENVIKNILSILNESANINNKYFINDFYSKYGFEFENNYLKDKPILVIKDQSKNYDDKHTEKIIHNKFKNEENLVLDLSLMEKITKNETGAKNALKNKEIPIFEILFDFILNQSPATQELSLSVLINLVNLITEEEIETIKELISKLIKKDFNNSLKNDNLYKFFCLMTKLIGNISEKNLNIREELVKIGCIDFILLGNNLFPQREELTLNTVETIYKLTNGSQSNISSIMNGKILYPISDYLENLDKDVKIPIFLCKLILKLTYKSIENKSKIGEFGFILRLVPLLIYHSNPERVNFELCLMILKCIANLSHLSKNCEIMIKDRLIPCYFDFFNNYKDKLNHMKILLFTIGNLCYEFNEFIIKEIIKDNILKLFNDTFDYYNSKSIIELLLIGINSLSNITHTQEICKELHNTNINESLCDFIKFQIYETNLMVKTLKCLGRFSFDDEMCNKIINHNGHIYIMNLINKYIDNDEIVFNSFKLLYVLSHKEYKENLEKMFNDGVPEDILENYNTEWKDPIILYSYKLFSKMCKIEEVKELLTEKFLLKLLNKLSSTSDNELLYSGLDLLKVISEIVISAEHIIFFEGNKTLDKLLEEHYKTNNRISYLCSEIIKNMLINDIKLCKPKYREILTHLKIDKAIEVVDESEKELKESLLKVQELLREDEDKEEKDEESISDVSEEEEIVDDEKKKKKVPPEIRQFLIHGKIVTVYLEDGKKRHMHMFVSSDYKFLKLKYPKENDIKPKYILKIHTIKELKKGYNNDSPIAKSKGFFTKPPKKEICFIIYGPNEITGPKNFHIVCKNPYEANKWMESINYILDIHKKLQVKGLKN